MTHDDAISEMRAMERRMTPFSLDILMHACVRADEYPKRGVPLVEETIRDFVLQGVIVYCDEPNQFTATPLGQAWLRRILNVPIPTMAFIDENGEVIS